METTSNAGGAAAEQAHPIEPDRALLAFTRRRDVACPRCGYNLRDLGSPLCPECGKRLELDVQIEEPFSRAWITTMVTLSLLGGCGVLFIGMLFWMWRIPDDCLEGRMLHVSITAVLSPILLVLAIVFRRRFMRLNALLQWGIAAFLAVNGVIAISLVH